VYLLEVGIHCRDLRGRKKGVMEEKQSMQGNWKERTIFKEQKSRRTRRGGGTVASGPRERAKHGDGGGKFQQRGEQAQKNCLKDGKKCSSLGDKEISESIMQRWEKGAPTIVAQGRGIRISVQTKSGEGRLVLERRLTIRSGKREEKTTLSDKTSIGRTPGIEPESPSEVESDTVRRGGLVRSGPGGKG